MRTTITAALMLLTTSQAAAAAPERYSCAEGDDTPTIFEVDRAAGTFLTSEDGRVQFDRQPVCVAFTKISPKAIQNAQTSCTLAFDNDVVVADYVVQGEFSANVMIALDTKKPMLTSIFRLGTTRAAVKTEPCKRL